MAEVRLDLDDVADGFVVKWFKRVGDSIVEGEPLVEVITDKVNIEITAPVSGTIAQLCFQEEDRVAAGDVLAVIDTA